MRPRTALQIRRARRRPRRDLLLGITVLAGVGLVAWISTVAINGLPWAHSYTLRVVLPGSGPLVRGGDEVRIAGERAGQVESVTLSPRRRGIATLSLDGAHVGRGASARIRPRGLAGAVYVDLSPGRSGHALTSGSTIRATAAVQLTDVIAAFDSSARRAVTQVTTGYGTGLAGRGADLGDVLAASPSLLNHLQSVSAGLSPTPGTLSGALAAGVAVADNAAGTGAIPGALSAARAVLATTAAHAGSISASIRSLPAAEEAALSVLPSADALLSEVSNASGQLAPGVRALATALPDIAALERDAPSITGLARVADATAPTFRALAPVLARAAGPVSALTPLSTPIAELASVLTPYGTELREAPLGFTRWGDFHYDFGTGAGHRAVRFSMVLTCALARDPYPAPGAASKERKPCP